MAASMDRLPQARGHLWLGPGLPPRHVSKRGLNMMGVGGGFHGGGGRAPTRNGKQPNAMQLGPNMADLDSRPSWEIGSGWQYLLPKEEVTALQQCPN